MRGVPEQKKNLGTFRDHVGLPGHSRITKRKKWGGARTQKKGKTGAVEWVEVGQPPQPKRRKHLKGEMKFQAKKQGRVSVPKLKRGKGN